MSLAHHIVIRPEDGRPLFTVASNRLTFTHVVVMVGRPFDVVSWGAGDNHGHVIVMADETTANELARRVEISLTLRLGLPEGFCAARAKSIDDQVYLYRSVPYSMTQGERHGIDCDPFHEGSSLPDAAGLRMLAPDLPARLRLVAPRFDPRHLLPPFGPAPAPDDAQSLAVAAAAATGLPRLEGRAAPVRAARRAVVELATEASPRALRDALSCSQDTIRRLRAMPPSPKPLLDAVVGQARWRSGVQHRPNAAAE